MCIRDRLRSHKRGFAFLLFRRVVVLITNNLVEYLIVVKFSSSIIFAFLNLLIKIIDEIKHSKEA